MSANAYARIAARYQVDASDDESVERFFLDVAPTLSREAHEAIVAELLTDDSAGSLASGVTEIPREVPAFPIEDAPPITRPNSLAQLVGELSAAVEKRVTERLDTALGRVWERLQKQGATRRIRRVSLLIQGPTVAVVESGATVRTAAQRMTERNVGMVAVVDEGMLAGVVSEHDIMARVVARGLDPNNTSVAAVMTKDPVIAEPEDNLDAALQKMQGIGSRHLPVVDGGKLLGMISIRDLLEVAAEAAGKASLDTELLTYSPDDDS